MDLKKTSSCHARIAKSTNQPLCYKYFLTLLRNNGDNRLRLRFRKYTTALTLSID